MKIILIFLKLLFIISFGLCPENILSKDYIYKGQVYVEGEITWKYGIAFIEGKARYIDPKRLDQSAMPVAISMIDKHRKENKQIIKAGRLIWDISDGEQVMVYNTTVNDPYFQDFNSEKIYHLKIKNYKTYLSEDKRTWEELKVEVVDDKPKYNKDRYDPPVYMIIRLKCKYFEGEYEIIGTTG